MTTASQEGRRRQPGERVILRVNRHWLLPVGQVLLTAPLMLVALVAVLAAAYAVDPGSWLPSLTWGLTVVGLWLGIPMLRWASASLTLTDRRLVLASGVLTRTHMAIALDGVQSIGLRQSLLGRLFGFGTIDVWTGLAGPQSFGPVAMRSLPDELFRLTLAAEEPEAPSGRPARRRALG